MISIEPLQGSITYLQLHADYNIHSSISESDTVQEPLRKHLHNQTNHMTA